MAKSRKDPTGTGNVRAAFKTQVQTRILRLRKLIKVAIVDQDLMGLATGGSIPAMRPGMVMGMTSDAKLKMFSDWFNGVLYNQLVGDWTKKFMSTAYLMGVDDAAKETKKPMFVVKGSVSKTLAQLSVHELEGIADATLQKMTRDMTDWLIKGARPKMVSDGLIKMLDDIAWKRCILLANTLTVRAYNDGKLDVYAEVGMEKVGINPETKAGKPHTHDAPRARPSAREQRRIERANAAVEGDDEVEVLTAGDDFVCDECEDIADNGPYTINEARGLIPAHPNCRCAFVPASDRRYAAPARLEAE